jgi:hypothetical protein
MISLYDQEVDRGISQHKYTPKAHFNVPDIDILAKRDGKLAGDRGGSLCSLSSWDKNA